MSGVRSCDETASGHRGGRFQRSRVARADRTELLAALGTDRAVGTPRRRLRTAVCRRDRLGADGAGSLASVPGRVLARRRPAQVVVVEGRRGARHRTRGDQPGPVPVPGRDERAVVGRCLSQCGTSCPDEDPRPGRASRWKLTELAARRAQSRQNSLPSTSCITRHDSLMPSARKSRTRTAPNGSSRAHSTSRADRRSSPTSPVPTRTSR